MTLMFLLLVGLAFAVGVATATAGNRNSDATNICKKCGHASVPTAKSTSGNENFPGDLDQSLPTTFAAGTVDPR